MALSRCSQPGTARPSAHVPVSAPTSDEAPNPDADLIRICAEHIANVTTYNAEGGHLESADDPLWHAYERTLEAIGDAKPATIAGIIAKAKAAKYEAQEPHGEEPDHCDAGAWAWDIVNDLVRLNGTARELSQVAA